MKIRHKTAKEAATLLYFGLEKEFRQAKVKAATTFGTKLLPSNLEIAIELDRLAEETEGSARTEKLIQMRIEALAVMEVLKPFSPLLVGSVWRGTIRRGSDIDIEVFSIEPHRVAATLEAKGVKPTKIEQVATTERGRAISSTHVYFETASGNRMEVVVRDAEEAGRKRICDIFGDHIKGLTLQELKETLKNNPEQRFLPT